MRKWNNTVDTAFLFPNTKTCLLSLSSSPQCPCVCVCVRERVYVCMLLGIELKALPLRGKPSVTELCLPFNESLEHMTPQS